MKLPVILLHSSFKLSPDRYYPDMVLKRHCAAESAALGLHVPFKMCCIATRGDFNPAVGYSGWMEAQSLKLAFLKWSMSQFMHSHK